jgi:hypothetical protein
MSTTETAAPTIRNAGTKATTPLMTAERAPFRAERKGDRLQ